MELRFSHGPDRPTFPHPVKHISLLTLILLTLFTGAIKAADLNRYAFTLEYSGQSGVSCNGTGCLVKYGNSIYYITAHHIFENVDDTAMAAIVGRFTIVNEADKSFRLKPETYLTIPNVKDISKTDFLIFRIKSTPQLDEYTLTVAPTSPQKGETVYLAAALPGKALGAYPLMVLDANDERVLYEKIPGIEKYTGASGGPIINAHGELVGTYLGRQLADAQTIHCLFGTPCSSLKTVLESLSTISR
jgi:hypothetical protein